MYRNIFSDTWKINVTVTNTLDLVHRLFYKLDKNISLLSKLSEIQNIIVDDYQLITMNQFPNKQNFMVENNKIIPVPKYDLNTDYDGSYFTFFEIKNRLPRDTITATINNTSLNNFLKNVNMCDSKIIDIKSKNKTKYDNVLLNTYVTNNNCIGELQYLPQIIHDYHKSIKILNKGGNLYVNLSYYYHEPSLIFLQYILSLFESIEYIHNPLVSNKIGYNIVKFNNYSGIGTKELKLILKEYKIQNKDENVTIINSFYCNKQDASGLIIKTLFDNKLDNNFMSYLGKIYKQQNEYFKILIKRVNFIDYKKVFRHINNQIDIAITYCEKHKIEMNDIYKESKIIVKPYVIKKYFRFERGVDLLKIKMTSDSLYSVSSPDVANEMSRLIKNALPNIKTIIDGTANIGGNTLSFSSYFDNVISIEINPKTFEVLKNNVDTFKRKNIKLINDDFLNLTESLTGDVIFMDPPWTGTFYKMYENMDLFLSDVNIIDIIPKLKCKMVALKLPLNYNIKGLLEKVGNLQIFKIYGVMLVLIKK
jgi:hypothetical protein